MTDETKIMSLAEINQLQDRLLRARAGEPGVERPTQEELRCAYESLRHLRQSVGRTAQSTTRTPQKTVDLDSLFPMGT